MPWDSSGPCHIALPIGLSRSPVSCLGPLAELETCNHQSRPDLSPGPWRGTLGSMFLRWRLRDSRPHVAGTTTPSRTLPQTHMEAHRGPYKKIVVLKGAPLHFHVNLEECKRLEIQALYERGFVATLPQRYKYVNNTYFGS